jgi:hypothetical protein
MAAGMEAEQQLQKPPEAQSEEKGSSEESVRMTEIK